MLDNIIWVRNITLLENLPSVSAMDDCNRINAVSTELYIFLSLAGLDI